MSKKTILTLIGIFVAIVLIVLVNISHNSSEETLVAGNTDEIATTTVVNESSPSQTTTTNQSPSMQTDSTPTPHSTKVAMTTNLGPITLELFDAQTPQTVENFKKLAQSGFYNGTRFHRVIEGFMIQGGDPLSASLDQKDMWGTGGPGYTFNDEIGANNSNTLGTISMANAGPNTNGSQFFINTADNSFLNPKHTVFGRVVGGMDVVRAIETIETDQTDKPLNDVIIESIQIQ